MADFNYEGLWNETMLQLWNDMGDEEFAGWFLDMKYLRAGEDSIVIGFPSAFNRDKVKCHFQGVIKSILNKLTDRKITLEYEVVKKTELVILDT